MALDINALGITDEEIPLDYETMAEQPSAFRPNLPQPGTYRFQLPNMDNPEMYETFVTDKGRRLRVHFRNTNPLLIKPAGLQFSCSINNAERQVKDNWGSDLAWLLKALGYKDVLRTMNDYVKAISSYGGAEFVADISYSGTCNTKREAYVEGKKSGRMGCGQEYRMDAYTKRTGAKVLSIPRNPDGSWADEFDCHCGAGVRCFANLSRFQSAEKVPF